MAIPFGIAGGLFLAESDGRIAGTLRLAADVLSGVPSIVVGIFAYAVLVAHGIGHFSAVAASFAIGILMLPIIMRASETAIRGVPVVLSEAGLALGARRCDGGAQSRPARRHCPASSPECSWRSPAGQGRRPPCCSRRSAASTSRPRLLKPMAAIPLVIFQNGIQAYPDLVKIAWGSALFLVVDDPRAERGQQAASQPD